jgi:hypothetical protein
MAEIKEFVVNDRRKFTAEGDARPDAPPYEPKAPRPESLLPQDDSSARLVEQPAQKGPQPVPNVPPADTTHTTQEPEPPALTAEQTAAADKAYTATVGRLDTAVRAVNPGMEPIPTMSFERVLQSVYMQGIMQLGVAAAPGQQPQVDLLGARQTIDMVAVLAEKTAGNLSEAEDKLMQSALFELRMAFLEVTQAIARQAQQRQPQPGQPGFPPPPGGGPSIVR